MKYLKTYELTNLEYDMKHFILKDCEPFITQLRECNRGLLYHGTYEYDSFEQNTFIKIKNKKRMSSKDTPINLHNYMCDKFTEKIGWSPREESIFCHNGEYQPGINEDYGKNYIIFPIGEFKYVWSPKYEDLYLSLYNKFVWFTRYEWRKKFPSKKILDITDNETLEDSLGYSKEKFYQVYEMLDDYIDSCVNSDFFCDYLRTTHEIMLNADYYFLVKGEYEDDIKKIIYNV